MSLILRTVHLLAAVVWVGSHAMRRRQVVIWLARLNLLVVLAILLCGVWLTGA